MFCHTEEIQEGQLLMDVRLTPHVPSAIRKMEEDKLELRALIDTGATGSIISRKAASELKLVPLGMTPVETGAGTCEQNVYRVNLHPVFRNHRGVERVLNYTGVKVTEFPGSNFDVILGMDLIMRGSLYVADGRFTFCI